MSRELYKTKLCMLYQRGNCHRHSCSFAHGQDELRRAPSGAHRDHYDDRKSYSGDEDRHSSRSHRREDRHYREEKHSRYSPVQRARAFDRRPSNDPGHEVQPRKSPSRYQFSPRSNAQKVSNIEGETKKGSELSEARPEVDGKEVQSDSLMKELQKAKEDVHKLDKKDKQLQASLQTAREEVTRLTARVAELESKEASARKAERRCQQLEHAFTHYIRCKVEMERATAMMEKLMSQANGEYPHESLEPLSEDDSKRKTSNGDTHQASKRQKCDSEEKLQFTDDEASE